MTWRVRNGKYGNRKSVSAAGVGYAGSFPCNTSVTIDIADRLSELVQLLGAPKAIAQAEHLGLSQWEAADLIRRNITFCPSRDSRSRSWPARK